MPGTHRACAWPRMKQLARADQVHRGSLETWLRRDRRHRLARRRTQRLIVIATRAESLSRFMQAYARRAGCRRPKRSRSTGSTR